MKISDEAMIAALIKYGSRRKAAEELGINQATITHRLEREDFRQKYEEAKAAMLNEAVDGMKSQLKGAVDTLTDVMNDKSNPATVRVSAADSLLRHTVRYVETVEIERRIIRLERSADDELQQPSEST